MVVNFRKMDWIMEFSVLNSIYKLKTLEDLVHTSMVDSVVSERSGVDERGSVVDGVVGDRGSMDEGSGVVDEGLVGAGNTLILHVWFHGLGS